MSKDKPKLSKFYDSLNHNSKNAKFVGDLIKNNKSCNIDETTLFSIKNSYFHFSMYVEEVSIFSQTKLDVVYSTKFETPTKRNSANLQFDDLELDSEYFAGKSSNNSSNKEGLYTDFTKKFLSNYLKNEHKNSAFSIKEQVNNIIDVNSKTEDDKINQEKEILKNFEDQKKSVFGKNDIVSNDIVIETLNKNINESSKYMDLYENQKEENFIKKKLVDEIKENNDLIKINSNNIDKKNTYSKKPIKIKINEKKIKILISKNFIFSIVCNEDAPKYFSNLYLFMIKSLFTNLKIGCRKTQNIINFINARNLNQENSFNFNTFELNQMLFKKKTQKSKSTEKIINSPELEIYKSNIIDKIINIKDKHRINSINPLDEKIGNNKDMDLPIIKLNNAAFNFSITNSSPRFQNEHNLKNNNMFKDSDNSKRFNNLKLNNSNYNKLGTKSTNTHLKNRTGKFFAFENKNYYFSLLLFDQILLKPISNYFTEAFNFFLNKDFPLLTNNYNYEGFYAIRINQEKIIYSNESIYGFKINKKLMKEILFQADILQKKYILMNNKVSSFITSSTYNIKKIELKSTFPRIHIFIKFIPVLDGICTVHCFSNYDVRLNFEKEKGLDYFSGIFDMKNNNRLNIPKYYKELNILESDVIRSKSDNFYLEPNKILQMELFLFEFLTYVKSYENNRFANLEDCLDILESEKNVNIEENLEQDEFYQDKSSIIKTNTYNSNPNLDDPFYNLCYIDHMLFSLIISKIPEKMYSFDSKDSTLDLDSLGKFNKNIIKNIICQLDNFYTAKVKELKITPINKLRIDYTNLTLFKIEFDYILDCLFKINPSSDIISKCSTVKCDSLYKNSLPIVINNSQKNNIGLILNSNQKKRKISSWSIDNAENDFFNLHPNIFDENFSLTNFKNPKKKSESNYLNLHPKSHGLRKYSSGNINELTFLETEMKKTLSKKSLNNLSISKSLILPDNKKMSNGNQIHLTLENRASTDKENKSNKTNNNSLHNFTVKGSNENIENTNTETNLLNNNTLENKINVNSNVNVSMNNQYGFNENEIKSDFLLLNDNRNKNILKSLNKKCEDYDFSIQKEIEIKDNSIFNQINKNKISSESILQKFEFDKKDGLNKNNLVEDQDKNIFSSSSSFHSNKEDNKEGFIKKSFLKVKNSFKDIFKKNEN